MSSTTRNSRSIEAIENTVENVEKNLHDLGKKLFEDIQSSTISESEQEMMKSIKTILDVEGLLRNFTEAGLSVEAFSLSTFPKFIDAVNDLAIDFSIIPEEVVEKQYKKFVNICSKEFLEENGNKLKSLEIWKRLFKRTNLLYEGIELVLHCAATAAVKSSCESVVESLVSKYEYHSNSRRNCG